MPPVQTAEQAIKIANRFLSKHHKVIYVKLLLSAREGDLWVVEFDIGPFKVEVVKVKIDASSGEIVEYEGSRQP
ncbi:MAG: PepSY domain-containing protein [Chloroflexi bacterium]|nr:PepSY domain-containing protein [Chloroflexota bacterium]